MRRFAATKSVREFIRWTTRHARAVLAGSALLALAAAVGATQIPTDAGIDTLVDSGAPAYRATQEVRQAFGEEPIVVLAEGDLRRLLLTANLVRLLRLESCLGGKLPPGAKPLPGPCAELARMRPVAFLAGPATFLNEAVIQIDEQLQQLAARLPPQRLQRLAAQVASEYGIHTLPSFGNAEFTEAVVFSDRPSGTPKPKLAYLFPNAHSAQIVMRLRPNLDEAERHRAIGLIREAVRETTPRAACGPKGSPAPCFALRGGHYVLSGVPVVVDGLARALKDALLVLLAVAVAVMALALLLVFRSRMRLLPLCLALAAAAITFGLFWLLGGALTMASIAVLPILVGLAVDYAIQFQARFDEAEAEGRRGADAAISAVLGGGPAIATACLATAVGFLALLLSPVPMVRTFALLLVLGVAIAFGLSLTAGFAALSLRREGVGEGRFSGRTRAPERLASFALSRPRTILSAGLAFAVIGWGVGTQIDTQSDIRKLAPQSIEAVRELNRLQDATGVSGELDVKVEAPDRTDPATLEWMAAFKRRVLRDNGFSGAHASCLSAEVCPGPALSDFVVGSGPLHRAQVRAALRGLPEYDLRQVAHVDPATGLP